MTSRKTSFLRYRMPSDRQDTAFVTAIGGRAWISSLWDSWVMYLNPVSPPTPTQRTGSRLLKDLGLGRLGISEIHHLIQQLVNDDEVIPDTLLLQLLEVLCKHFDNPVQEQQYLRGVRVPLC